MRVLHVAEVAHGGVVTLVHTFAEQQVAAGHDTHLLVPEGVRVGHGTAHRWHPARSRPDRYHDAVRRLGEVVRAVRPDVVHLHSFFPGLFGRSTRVLDGVGVVYQPHSWAFTAVDSRIAATAVGAWERRALRRTHAVVTNCRDELQEAVDRGIRADRRGHVIGLPVDTAHFTPGDAVRARAELPVDGATRVLVCVGRLSRQKGQDLLASAWEADPLRGTTLVLVGPGDTETVRRLAPTTFGSTLLAAGPADDVLPWLRAADLALLPSRYEGQSVAMAEALSCGVPVVMTDVNGAREAIAPPGQDPAGAVLDVGDMTGILSACRSRLDEPARRAREAEVARSRAVEMFSTNRVMERLGRVYNQAIDLASGQR